MNRFILLLKSDTIIDVKISQIRDDDYDDPFRPNRFSSIERES